MKYSLQMALFLAGVLLGQSSAQATQKEDFVGEYSLQENISGNCPPEISIITEHFNNETSSPSLGVYCRAGISASCDGVIYQMTDIDSGPLWKINTHPMFGYFDSISYTHQQIKANTLIAHNKTTSMFGKLLYKQHMEMVLDADRLSYVYSTVNNINEEYSFNSSCTFSRKVER